MSINKIIKEKIDDWDYLFFGTGKRNNRFFRYALSRGLLISNGAGIASAIPPIVDATIKGDFAEAATGIVLSGLLVGITCTMMAVARCERTEGRFKQPKP